jgi:hypothetical protein
MHACGWSCSEASGAAWKGSPAGGILLVSTVISFSVGLPRRVRSRPALTRSLFTQVPRSGILRSSLIQAHPLGPVLWGFLDSAGPRSLLFASCSLQEAFEFVTSSYDLPHSNFPRNPGPRPTRDCPIHPYSRQKSPIGVGEGGYQRRSTINAIATQISKAVVIIDM